MTRRSSRSAGLPLPAASPMGFGYAARGTIHYFVATSAPAHLANTARADATTAWYSSLSLREARNKYRIGRGDLDALAPDPSSQFRGHL